MLVNLSLTGWEIHVLAMRGVLRAGVACGLALGLTAEGAFADALGITTNTLSTTEQIVLNPATTSTTNTITSWLTQIIGKFAGGTVYDQSFAFPYANPTVQAGKTAAIAAITTAGGPGVIIGSPVLTATSQTPTGSTTTTTYSLATGDLGPFQTGPGTVKTALLELVVGPGSTLTGPRTVCSNIGSLPSTLAPTCGAGSPTTFVVLNGNANINTNIDTKYIIDQSTMTANTFQLFEQYTISGTGAVQALGLVHGAVPSLLGDNSERFTRRLLDEAIMGEGTGWADGFGWRSSGNGDTRSGAGLDGGAGFNSSDKWRWGFGVSQGWTNVDLDNAGGSASGSLTELGLYGRWHDKGAYLAAAAVGGFGNTSTSSTVSGSAMAASYSTSLISLAGEAGYEMDMGHWSLVPNIGGQWQQVSLGGFTELALPP